MLSRKNYFWAVSPRSCRVRCRSPHANSLGLGLGRYLRNRIACASGFWVESVGKKNRLRAIRHHDTAGAHACRLCVDFNRGCMLCLQKDPLDDSRTSTLFLPALTVTARTSLLNTNASIHQAMRTLVCNCKGRQSSSDYAAHRLVDDGWHVVGFCQPTPPRTQKRMRFVFLRYLPKPRPRLFACGLPAPNSAGTWRYAQESSSSGQHAVSAEIYLVPCRGLAPLLDERLNCNEATCPSGSADTRAPSQNCIA